MDYKWKWNDTMIEIILDEENMDDKTQKDKNLKELENFVLKIKFNRISSGLVKKMFNGGIDNISKC